MSARLASLSWRSEGRMIWADVQDAISGPLLERFVGVMDSVDLAVEAVNAHNERLARVLRPPTPEGETT